MSPAHGRFRKTRDPQVEIRSVLTRSPEGLRVVVEWNGYFLLTRAVHSGALGFRKLHPRSLLERR